MARETYSHLSPPQEFEIVEAIKGPGPGNTAAVSWALTLAWHSTIQCSVGDRTSAQFGATAESDDPILRRISPLITLVESYFKPKLNRNGLFDAFADAVQCRDCMMALREKYIPNLWEHDESSDFQPVSLYRIQT